MKPPIFVAFWTRGTLYETEVNRLLATLRAWDLAHHVDDIDSLGDWVANTRHTPAFMGAMMDQFPDRPVVYLDADAVVWKYPALFDELGTSCDIAVHYANGRLLGNGTTYMAPTPKARETIQRYEDLIRENPDCRNEQTMLQRAIEDVTPRVHQLPPGYLYIGDICPAFGAGDEVVIQHYQASRERNHCDAWARRQAWLKEADARIANLRQPAHAVP